MCALIKIRDDRVHFKKERRSSESLVLMRDLEQNEVNTYKTKKIFLIITASSHLKHRYVRNLLLMSVHCLTVETFDVKGLAEISSGTTLPIINFTCLLKIVWDGYIKFLTEWCF